ncbi:hypothetical protein HHI36_015050 [Cryptolaemus montrouzieri]|uniref:Secreted protein n=1 Tax=Cryptolaemus montrouzieri TaxID=559131 RepID=A0ABD2N4I8_9CUCU
MIHLATLTVFLAFTLYKTHTYSCRTLKVCSKSTGSATNVLCPILINASWNFPDFSNTLNGLFLPFTGSELHPYFAIDIELILAHIY